MSNERECIIAINEGFADSWVIREDIVRCKDCKHWVGNGAEMDEFPYWLPCKHQIREPDYFCADGERQDSDG